MNGSCKIKLQAKLSIVSPLSAMSPSYPTTGKIDLTTVSHPSQLTMYDLPSEFPEEPGLPDIFHYLQPQLLSATFRLSDYVADQIFTAGDLNVYYDVNHPLWHKRPGWFAVAGVPRLYEQRDLRLSYVIWQEKVPPSVVVELLSPGTGNEDLGRTQSAPGQPPTKWQVYEQILKVPYYVVFDRYTDHLRVFGLTEERYDVMTDVILESDQPYPKIWLPTLNIGIGLWHGTYENTTRPWLRWFDASGEWILTDAEQARQQAEQAQLQAEQAQQRSDRLAAQLRELGIDPDLV
ncbi:MAG: Uma2 family endonuclease [Leptolyngbyaceae bacterium]|nr:Uma2 family endonuclease [Leptolyngbyaceae bacterium]